MIHLENPKWFTRLHEFLIEEASLMQSNFPVSIISSSLKQIVKKIYEKTVAVFLKIRKLDRSYCRSQNIKIIFEELEEETQGIVLSLSGFKFTNIPSGKLIGKKLVEWVKIKEQFDRHIQILEDLKKQKDLKTGAYLLSEKNFKQIDDWQILLNTTCCEANNQIIDNQERVISYLKEKEHQVFPKKGRKKRKILEVEKAYFIEILRNVLPFVKEPLDNFKNRIEKYDQELMKKKKESLRLAAFSSSQLGFHNFGGTCYMNTFLQILLHEKEFLKLFEKKWDHLKKEEQKKWEEIQKAFLELKEKIEETKKHPNEIQKKETIFSSFLEKLFQVQNFDKARNVKKVHSSLRSFFNHMKKSQLFPELENATVHTQMDIDEFLGSLIGASGYHFLKQYTIFLPKTKKNKESGFIVHQDKESKLILSLPKKEITFEELLKEKIQNDVVEEITIQTYKIKNGSLKEKSFENPRKFEKLNRQEKIYSQPPSILPVQISRYVFDENTFTRVKNTHSLKLSTDSTYDFSYLFENPKTSCFYKLTSFAVHSGGTSLDFGHYFACIWKNEANSWFLYNDDQVKKITFQEASELAEQAVWINFSKSEKQSA